MSIIKDNILYSPEEPSQIPLPVLDGNLGESILTGFEKVIAEQGDFDWLINATYSIEGQSTSCGKKNLMLSEGVQDARRIGAALYNAGLRKGDVVHFALPNCTQVHPIALGTWLCQAITSMGDPGLSVTVLKTQLLDTNAKIMFCYDGSRQVVKECLENLRLLGKVKVVIVEKACPQDGEDLPITEEGFQFFKGDDPQINLYHF
jgi:acyl-coenzyme A synthetase/AMP-(fatty) acid ligase